MPAIADKLLQTAGQRKSLRDLGKQDFLPCSFRYRPGTGAHKAVKDLSAGLRPGHFNYLVEADIKRFFDNIDHDKLLNRH